MYKEVMSVSVYVQGGDVCVSVCTSGEMSLCVVCTRDMTSVSVCVL